MNPTALGDYLILHPDFDGGTHWWLVAVNKRGFFTSAQRCGSKADAIAKRRKLRQWHATLFKRKQKRKGNPMRPSDDPEQNH